MDIKDGEQESQRKFMNSEFDNNYDALPLANDAAPKSSKKSNPKSTKDGRACGREEKVAKMNAVERDEFLLTDDFKSFISKTKRVMGDASKMEQDFARTNT